MQVTHVRGFMQLLLCHRTGIFVDPLVLTDNSTCAPVNVVSDRTLLSYQTLSFHHSYSWLGRVFLLVYPHAPEQITDVCQDQVRTSVCLLSIHSRFLISNFTPVFTANAVLSLSGSGDATSLYMPYWSLKPLIQHLKHFSAQQITCLVCRCSDTRSCKCLACSMRLDVSCFQLCHCVVMYSRSPLYNNFIQTLLLMNKM